MITITENGEAVTLINVFSCDPQYQQRLVDSWIRATEETLGKLPGIISAALHPSKDATRVINCAQWKSAENWRVFSASVASPGSVKWQGTPSQALISTRCVTCWIRPIKG
jgi:hypothetical protein